MDGVVADTGEAHFQAWQALLAESGRDLTREQFAETFGMANLPILRQWLGPQASETSMHEMAERKEELFRAQVQRHVRLLPGVERWLAHWRALGYRQAIASSGEMANIVAVIGVLGIANAFDALVSGAFLLQSKPHPGIFQHAAAALGATPAEALVIEDGIVGIEAAHRAGMRCIAVTNTHPGFKLAAADLVVASVDDIPADIMSRLLG